MKIMTDIYYSNRLILLQQASKTKNADKKIINILAGRISNDKIYKKTSNNN